MSADNPGGGIFIEYSPILTDSDSESDNQSSDSDSDSDESAASDHYDQIPQTTRRDPILDHHEYGLAKDGDVDARKNLLDRGLDWNARSPFWKLRIFRHQFWSHWGLDQLHISLESGNWKRHLEALGKKIGKDKCEGELIYSM